MGKSAKKKEKKKKSPVPSQITTLLRAEAGAAGIGQGDLSGIREEMNQTAGCLHGPVATPRKPSRMQIYIWRTVDDDFFSRLQTKRSPRRARSCHSGLTRNVCLHTRWPVTKMMKNPMQTQMIAPAASRESKCFLDLLLLTRSIKLS